MFRNAFDLSSVCNAQFENGLCVPNTDVIDPKWCLESSSLEDWFNALVDLRFKIVLCNRICELFPFWYVLKD